MSRSSTSKRIGQLDARGNENGSPLRPVCFFLWRCADPTAASGAEVKTDETRRAVVARCDVAIGDVVVIDIGGIDDDARDRRASCPHRRTRARAADGEPTRLSLIL